MSRNARFYGKSNRTSVFDPLRVRSHEKRNNLKPAGDFIRLKISLRLFSQLFTCVHMNCRNETQINMDFISAILTKTKFPIGMAFSCEQDLPKANWISADSLDIRFNAHVRLKSIASATSLWSFWQKWNFILGDKISCKHYPKWNVYTCPSKNRVVLKCSQNETSCEQNLFSHQLVFSNKFEFISLLMWNNPSF